MHHGQGWGVYGVLVWVYPEFGKIGYTLKGTGLLQPKWGVAMGAWVGVLVSQCLELQKVVCASVVGTAYRQWGMLSPYPTPSILKSRHIFLGVLCLARRVPPWGVMPFFRGGYFDSKMFFYGFICRPGLSLLAVCPGFTSCLTW